MFNGMLHGLDGKSVLGYPAVFASALCFYMSTVVIKWSAMAVFCFFMFGLGMGHELLGPGVCNDPGIFEPVSQTGNSCDMISVGMADYDHIREDLKVIQLPDDLIHHT